MKNHSIPVKPFSASARSPWLAGSALQPVKRLLALVSALVIAAPMVGASGVINIQFGMEDVILKSGFAATGQTTNDFWNFYSRNDGQGGWRTFGALTNLTWADNTPSMAGLTVSNAPGGWYSGFSDPMLRAYIYPFNSGNITVTVTNLPAGQYDVYVYGHEQGDTKTCSFELKVGNTSYGVKTNGPASTVPLWAEGAHYVLFRGILLADGQSLAALVRPVSGLPVISGIQLVTGAMPPVITAQPQSRTTVIGTAVAFGVQANSTAPLTYQWKRNGVDVIDGTNVSGASGSTLRIANVTTNDSGTYSVVVGSTNGNVASANAELTVVSPPMPGLDGWWPGDGNAIDLLGSHDGFLYNGVNFASGKMGQAFNFDGADDYVSFGNTIGNFGTNDFTIQFWLKTTSIDYVDAVLEKWPTCGYSSMFNIRMSGPGLGTGRLNAELCENAAATNFISLVSARIVNDGVFHHVALVRQATNLSFFIDGTFDVMGSTPGITSISNAVDLIAGKSVCVGVDGTTGLRGSLDDLQIYSRALSLAEIVALYNAANPGPPVIGSQPANQVVSIGGAAGFRVAAAGAIPLAYQWQKGGSNIVDGGNVSGATTSALTIANVTTNDGGSYSVLVSNTNGTTASSSAILTVQPSLGAYAVLNVQFGLETSTLKTGLAATGQTANDFWNFYTRSDGHGGYRPFGALTNLKWANGNVSSIGLTISNAPGAWPNGSTDPMFGMYLYPLSGANIAVTLTNVPTGQYDFYVYGHESGDIKTCSYELQAGTTSYGTKTNGPGMTLPLWVEGSHYVLFRNIPVTQGQPVVVLVRPQAGLAAISGIQMVTIGPSSPVITLQPESRTNLVGTTATFSVTANGTAPLAYQWQRSGVNVTNGANISGAATATLTLANVTTNDAASYSVIVSNAAGSATSSNALLIVEAPASLQFTATDYPVSESNSVAVITVRRVGSRLAAVSVNFMTAGGTATAGADYSSVIGTLTWADGDLADKTFSIPLVNDGLYETNETVILTLANPVGATLGTPNAATLTIVDDDQNAAWASQSGPATYRSPDSVDVSCEFHVPPGRQLYSLLWRPSLPTGWTMTRVSGDGGPQMEYGEILFLGALTKNPVQFTYTLNVPLMQIGPKQIGGAVEYQLDGMGNPLSVPVMPVLTLDMRTSLHSADYRSNYWVIDGTEASRVLTYWRAGAYHVDAAGLDGYMMGTGNTNAALHSADYRDPEWHIDGSELNRVLAYWRAGCYHCANDGVDGFAPCTSANPQAFKMASTLNDAAPIDPAAMFASPVTASQSGPMIYAPGATIQVTNQIVYSGSLLSLLWRANLPTNWNLQSVTGDGSPEAIGNEVVWTGSSVPPSPVNFVLTVKVPAGQTQPVGITGEAEYQSADAVNALTQKPRPDALALARLRFGQAMHLADGRLELQLLSLTNDVCNIEVSSTLTNWTRLSTMTNVTGSQWYVHPDATNQSPLFYRAVLP